MTPGGGDAAKAAAVRAAAEADDTSFELMAQRLEALTQSLETIQERAVLSGSRSTTGVSSPAPTRSHSNSPRHSGTPSCSPSPTSGDGGSPSARRRSARATGGEPAADLASELSTVRQSRSEERSRRRSLRSELRTLREDFTRLQASLDMQDARQELLCDKLGTDIRTLEDRASGGDGGSSAASPDGGSAEHREELRQLKRRHELLFKGAGDETWKAQVTAHTAEARLARLEPSLLCDLRKPFVSLCVCPPSEAAPSVPGDAMHVEAVLPRGREAAADAATSQTVAITTPNMHTTYPFGAVLQHASPQRAAQQVSDVCRVALSGLPVALLLLRSQPHVAADPKRPTVQAVGQTVFSMMQEDEREGTGRRWSLHLTCVEVRSDVVRDLLNLDPEYIGAQRAGPLKCVRHLVSAPVSGPEVSDCANPLVESPATLRKLLAMAARNVSAARAGEQRGHTAYVFTLRGRGGRSGGVAKGSIVVADVASDATELGVPRDDAGRLPDGAAALQAAVDERDRDRRYVKRSVDALSELFASPDDASAAAPASARSESPRREQAPPVSVLKRTAVYHLHVGQEVQVEGLRNADFLYLNHERGVVLGKAPEHEAEGRVDVKMTRSGAILPFLPSHLVPVEPPPPPQRPPPPSPRRRVSQSPARGGGGAGARSPSPSPRRHTSPSPQRGGAASLHAKPTSPPPSAGGSSVRRQRQQRSASRQASCGTEAVASKTTAQQRSFIALLNPALGMCEYRKKNTYSSQKGKER